MRGLLTALENGAGANACDGKHQISLLHLMASHGSLLGVQKLLEKKVRGTSTESSSEASRFQEEKT